MSTPTNYIVFNGAGAPTGFGYTPDGTLPTGAVACTAAQAAAFGQMTLAGGAIVQGAAPTPSLAQQALALMSAGLTITSTGTPSISAVYPVTPAAQVKYASLQSVVAATGAFPGGATTQPILDAAGNFHSVTPAQFTEIALAVAAFATPLQLILDGHTGTALPSASVTIP